jgi:hypothetical protein
METNLQIDSLIWPEIMPQLSKVVKSRDEWRSKAIRRAEELREQRKADRRHRELIAELKFEVESLKQSADADSKKSLDRPSDSRSSH